ncbi:M56 family metallopeptidase [Sphingobacterium thalpophilum]|uniref:Outer membrane receptor FepA n=1 Tax=Sphingobacterium thalpophilum TaxID=259 RepID=A0A4U9VAU4_9SPHI|nr:M56 family metallopeptidase [Sphingobacterium thalpophilum]VTR40194.1 outer membrane receptor FepA [Sphingobacterium thalpophilum]
MESLLTYILQVNLLLAMIYIGYTGLLKRLTFYTLNRAYFLIGGIFAFVYPFLDLRSLLLQRGLDMGVVGEQISFYITKPEVQDRLTLAGLIEIVFMVGAVILLLKFLLQLMSLLRIHMHSTADQWRTYFFRNVLIPIVPFSFLNKIYVNKQQHLDAELHDIFKHEDIHVKGLHSVDILLFEMILVCCWYNPFVWLLRRAIRQNLEFLTDQRVLDKGIDRQTYQYSLLNVSKKGTSIGLSNQFNFKLLKRRIMMMNKKRSSKIELSKYGFLLPLFLLAGAAFTVSRAEHSIEGVVRQANETPLIALPQVNPLDSLPDRLPAHTGTLQKKEPAADTVKNDAVRHVAGENNDKASGLKLVGLAGHDPLLMLDNVVIDREKLNALDPNTIESISVLKDKSATAIYGEKGEKGVVLITTKTGKSAAAGSVHGKVSGLFLQSDSTRTTKVKTVGIPTNVLYVIDGVKASPEEIKELSPNDIEHIHVIKDATAQVKYGRDGKNGVIEVTTKKWARQHPDKAGKSDSRLHTEGKTAEDVVKVIGYKKNDEGDKGGTVTVEGRPGTAMNTGAAAPFAAKTAKGVFVSPGKEGKTVWLGRQSAIGKPLIVVDGKVESVKLDDLKPSDIQSVEVLKDGAATARFGAAGDKGVIMVTTKKKAAGIKKAEEAAETLDGKTK